MLGELDPVEINQLLTRNNLGHLGCTDGTTVYIVPVNYRYQTDFLLCYSLEGQKIDMMRRNHSVCFQVGEMKNANEWKSVIIYGTYEEITDENELKMLRPHYTEYMMRKRTSLTAVPLAAEQNSPIEATTHRAQVFYRIRFNRVTGRFENGFLPSKDMSFDVSSTF